MPKQVKIEIPLEISFLELGLHKDDNGNILYSMNVFKEMLKHNNIELSQLTQDDIESLIVLWYINHRKNGGEPDMWAERIFNAVKDLPVFEPNIVYDAVIEPPTPEQIADLRAHLGLTQSQVASILDVTNRQLIGDYERGRKSPSPQTWTLFLLLTGQHPTLNISQK